MNCDKYRQKIREEGDSNSRGRETKGLAILRRCQAGPSSQM